jgi:hypothetical protein
MHAHKKKNVLSVKVGLQIIKMQLKNYATLKKCVPHELQYKLKQAILQYIKNRQLKKILQN